MKIGDVTVGMVTRAIDLYHRVAYAGLNVYKGPELSEDPGFPITMFLDRFEEESYTVDNDTCHRYILRLGNSMYPFMKLALGAQIVQGEYFFSVDTHDDMFKGISPKESEEIARVRVFNRWVKDQIEEIWAEMDLPTTATLKGLIHERKLLRRRKPLNKTILVVDDDHDIGDTIQLVLEAMGFTVERLFDGSDAVEEADPSRHVMIIMDNEMSEMDGLEALNILKDDPARNDIPIIIATTQNLDFSRLERSDAFLHKPFHADVLMSFVNHLLGTTDDEGPG